MGKMHTSSTPSATWQNQESPFLSCEIVKQECSRRMWRPSWSLSAHEYASFQHQTSVFSFLCSPRGHCLPSLLQQMMWHLQLRNPGLQLCLTLELTSLLGYNTLLYRWQTCNHIYAKAMTKLHGFAGHMPFIPAVIDRWTSEFKASLVYIVSCNKLKDHVSKNPKKPQNKQINKQKTQASKQTNYMTFVVVMGRIFLP